MDVLAPLVALRQGQGLSVALVDVENIYDEFSYGMKTPQSLREFLNRVRSAWQIRPRYALLVGDASFDPRDDRGYGSFDLIPTMVVEMGCLETACDDRLADFDGDGVPEIAVGKPPARTEEELQIIVSKLVNYEAQSMPDEALLVADIDGEALIGQAILRAKGATQDLEVRRTCILFGDPTAKLKY